MTYRKVSTVLRSCLLGLLCALFAGCGILGESVDKNFTARTRINADVPKGVYSYDSTKDQQIDYTVAPDGTKEFHVKSNTPEAAIASAAKAIADSQAAFSAVMAQFIQVVVPIVQGAIKGGALGGGPGAAVGAAAGALKAGGSNAVPAPAAPTP